MTWLWPICALATDEFDPSEPQERFEGRETWMQAEDVRLWNAIERWDDPDRALFVQEAFNSGLSWRDTDASPWIATAFGSATPPSSTFLLHVGLHEETAEGTPVLMIPGAGDNASRGFVTLATKLDRLNRPIFALTFAHPHGDLFQQAEVVADAISVIRERTGAEQVDLVGHSKGGIALALYLSHVQGAPWPPPYAGRGTPYRGDVRRAVFVATPLGGVDTSYRWTGLNLYALDADTAINPTSWDRYYPNGASFPLVFDELVDQDFLPDGEDLFPGQRQLLSRQSPPLPGAQPWMGVYSLQPDWFTTYEGGTGFLSRSDGIDAAIDAGGDLIELLGAWGVDPEVEYYVLAGDSPLMPNGDDALVEQFRQLGDVVDWPQLLEDANEHGLSLSADEDELSGLERGWLVLGELSGPSDGLVFVDSATREAPITARGGTISESYIADLSHLDLLYASPITGELLIEAADEGGPDEQWMRGVGQRYAEADTLGFLERVLADPPGSEDPEEPAEPGEDPAGAPPGDYRRPCGSCETGAPGGWMWALAALLLRRR
jgi:triacylglycerol lipase